MYYDCYNGLPFGPFVSILQVLLWVFLVLVVVRAIRGSRWRDMNWRSWRGDTAEELLKERFVKGDISREEYEEKLRVIRGDASTEKKS